MHADTPHDDLDALIDDVARGMTAGPPSSSLLARVRQRIDRPAAAKRMPFWQLAPVAAALVLIAAVLMWRSPDRVVEPLERTLAQTDVPLPPAPIAPAVAAPPAKPLPAPGVPRRVGRSVAPVAALAAGPIVIEPIRDLEPIAPATVAVDAIAQPMPLTVAPVAVEPLILE